MKKSKITVCGVAAAFLFSGCGQQEAFSAVQPAETADVQIQEAYAPIIEDTAIDSNTEVELQDKVYEGTMQKRETAGKTESEQDLEVLDGIRLNKVTLEDADWYEIGETDYLIKMPNTEAANTKTAVFNTAEKLNVLQNANPEILFYTYYVNRATDMDWYEADNIKVFSYADYFKEQLGEDTKIRTGQYVLKDMQHYMDTGYKTDFHVNHKGTYEVYQDIYGMLSGDMELSKMLVPEKENDYNHLLFSAMKNADSLGFSDEQLDVFKTYSYGLGEYDSFIGGKKAQVGLEKEYEQGKIVRDIAFDHQFSYYGGQADVVEFDFHHPEKPNLLIISDSQGRPSRKLLAYHFNKTVFLDDFQYRDYDIQQVIQENDIGVVIFMGQISLFEWYE